MSNDRLHCFHCQELLLHDNPQRYSSTINNETRYFCCPACTAVADAIHNLGLDQYYRQRDSKPQRPVFIDTQILETQYQTALRPVDGTQCEIQLFIPDIHCTSCCWLIEKRLRQLDAVIGVHAQFHSHKLTVRWHKDQLPLSGILLALQHIGYRTVPWQPSTQQETTRSQQKKLLQRLGVAGLLAMQIHMVAMGGYFGAGADIQQWLNAVALLLSLPVWFYCADVFFRNAYNSLRNIWAGSNDRLVISMDFPIALAIVAAAIASILAVVRGTDDVYFDSIAMFVFLLLGARFLEARARNRLAEYSQEPVLPQTCIRLCDGQREIIDIHSLQLHDRVLIESGIVPVDGTVLDGSASIEQAIITGEFLPVQKQKDDRAIAGTTVLNGQLLVQAEHWGADSHIAHLHQRMEQALTGKQQRNTSMQWLYSTVAQFFTPVVLLIATGSALFWWWADAARALPGFLAVLVASCPCALTLALPAALTAATLQLRRQGILVTGNHVLQTLPTLFHYVFDKTGTLTQGRMHITQIQTYSELPESECLALAAAMERYSTHPVASAFHPYKSDDVCFTERNITSVMHCGIETKKDDGTYRLGKRDWACSECSKDSRENNNDETMQVFLTKNNRTLAVFSLGDPLRERVIPCISQLKNSGIHCTIASGDHSGTVDDIARTLSITDTHRRCTPEQKVQIIEDMRRKNGGVLMVGDGINDAPVLAHADVSVALADASQTAQLAADVILLNNRLDDLLILRDVALRTRTIARQSIAWALLYNASILPLAASGRLTPVDAAIGMALSSLLVTLNALRLFPRTR